VPDRLFDPNAEQDALRLRDQILEKHHSVHLIAKTGTHSPRTLPARNNRPPRATLKNPD
jgi:hypothetical protein